MPDVIVRHREGMPPFAASTLEEFRESLGWVPLSVAAQEYILATGTDLQRCALAENHLVVDEVQVGLARLRGDVAHALSWNTNLSVTAAAVIAEDTTGDAIWEVIHSSNPTVIDVLVNHSSAEVRVLVAGSSLSIAQQKQLSMDVDAVQGVLSRNLGVTIVDVDEWGARFVRSHDKALFDEVFEECDQAAVTALVENWVGTVASLREAVKLIER